MGERIDPRVRRLAGELVARAIDDILTGGEDGYDHALPSAIHVIGVSAAELAELRVALGDERDRFTRRAGSFGGRPNREIALTWRKP